MSGIKIDKDTISYHQANFNSYIKDSFKTGAHTWVDDSSTGKIDKCNELVQNATDGLADAIYQFNTFLNNVSHEFTRKDNALSKHIKSITINNVEGISQQNQQKKNGIKKTASYKKLNG